MNLASTQISDRFGIPGVVFYAVRPSSGYNLTTYTNRRPRYKEALLRGQKNCVSISFHLLATVIFVDLCVLERLISDMKFTV